MGQSVIQEFLESIPTADATRLMLERYERATRGSGGGLWDWDLMTGSVWYSPSLKLLLGYTETDPFPNTFAGFHDHLHPDYRSLMLRSVRRHLEQQHAFDLECQMRTRSGELRWFNLRGSAERHPAGHPLRLSGSMRDITGQKRLEASLRQSQKMEAVGQLTGGVAHDFNNLLSVIIGNLQLLERPLRGHERLLKHVQTALRASLRGADLARRLLTFARQTTLEPCIANINKLIQGMQELLRRSLGREIEIHSELAEDPWPVRIDHGQFENCILNLAINARDAMPKGGTLTIGTRNITIDAELASRYPQLHQSDYLLVTVSDSGVGMMPEVVKRAFEPFFTTKAVGKGTGLGLSMVYSFLEQSGGVATIYSEPGAGTTLRLYFPRSNAGADEQIAAGTQGNATADKAPRGTETVLVVEDDPDVRDTALRALRSFGYHVLEAGSAAEGLQVLETHEKVDLLFSDVTLPGGMHGPALAQQARKLRPALKVLFTSGFSETVAIRHGSPDGGLSLISKPYALIDLARRVRAVLDQD